jgi:tetratricopeptide (TPR) repeat protein
VQEEVTRRVSQSLALELLPGSVGGTRKYASSSAAYDAFLKGRFFWNKMTSEGNRNSLTYFTDAIAIDPGFAPAYSGLANCYLQMGASRVGTMKPIDAVARARPLLQRAMDLDNAMAEAHCTLGLMKSWYDLDWAGAEWEFKEALRLDASHLTTLQWQSLYLGAMGRHDEAIASVTRAVESEPLSPIMHAYLGIARGHALQFEMGLRELKQSIELDSHSYRPHMFLGNMYFDMERYEDGFAEVKLARSMNPDNLECIAYIGFAMAKLGDRQGALDAHQELLRAAEGRTEPALLASFIYAGLGEDAEMFRSLWEAMQKKCAPLYLVPLTGVFRRYRSDPRYGDFLRAMGLPQLARV